MKKTKGTMAVDAPPLAALPPSGAAALTFDPRAYSHFLDDTGWTEAQKDEFTEALWQIVVGFVDMGFDLHPIQQIDTAGESTLELDSPGVVFCSHSSKPNEKKTRRAKGKPREERIHETNIRD